MRGKEKSKHGLCPECKTELAMVECWPSGVVLRVCDGCGWESQEREPGAYSELMRQQQVNL